MRKEIVKKLLTITEEELEILKSTNKLSSIASSNIQGNSLYDDGGVHVRKSTRYIGFDEHEHSFIEISIGVIGTISHVIDQTPISIGKNDILVMNRNVIHEIKYTKERDVALNILVREPVVKELLDRISKDTKFYEFVYNLFYGTEKIFHVQESSKSNIESDVDVLLENIYFNTFFKEVIRSNVDYIIMKILYMTYKNYNQIKLEVELTEETLTQYIAQNYSTASLEELSKVFNIEYYQLSKDIKKLTGENFKDIVQKERLEIATKLLRYSKLSVREISSQIGYENYSYFYKIFSKKYKMTPSSYRKLHL